MIGTSEVKRETVINGKILIMRKSTGQKVWGFMQQQVYEHRANSIDKLKQRLVDWYMTHAVCSRTLLTQASTSRGSDWECACIADEPFEHLLWAR